MDQNVPTPLEILLVADDPETIESVRAVLDECDIAAYRLRTARGYREGLDALSEEADVCIVGQRLGEEDGVELIREARTRSPGTSAVLLADAESGQADRDALDAGAVDCLPRSELVPGRLERVVRYAAERARRHRAELRFRALVETSHDLVSVLAPDGTLEYVSPSLRELLGFDPGEKLGQDVILEVHPEDRSRVEDRFREIVGGPPGQHVRLEPYRVRTADGEWRTLETTATNHTTTPGIGGVVVHSTDITERVARKKQIEIQARLLNAVGQAVIASDVDGTVFYWNPAAERMYGWTPDEAVGRNVMDLTTPDTTREQAAEIMEALLQGQPWEGEFEVRRKDGTTFRALVTDSPILDESGELEGVIGISSDITGIKETELELRERVKELRTLHQASRILNDADRSIDERLQQLVDIIPDGWLYPSITEAWLELGRRRFVTPGFRETEWTLTAPVPGSASENGRIGVTLTEPRPELDFGPFLQEEQELLDNLARMTADVLGRVRAEEELRASEERFRQIAESIHDVFWISSADRRTVLYVSPAFEEIWGFQGEEVIADPARWMESILPSDRERVQRKIEAAADSEGAVEYRILRPDGEIRWIYDRAFPVEEDGEVRRLIGIAEDITERKLAEERYSILSQQIGDHITVILPDGRISLATPQAPLLLGYEPEEAQGRTFFEFVHPEDRDEARRVFNDIVHRPGGLARLGYRGITADGEIRHLESVARNRIDHPAIGGLVVTTRDVTERVELEEQLRQAQKMEAVGRLAGGIAHDFNNLLTVIRSETDLVRLEMEDGAGDQALLQAMDSIAGTTDRAAELTRQLLAFSREQVLQPRVVDLAAVVEGAVRLLDRVIGERIRISVQTDVSVPPVRIDPGQLEHSIVNLAINARDAMPDGGTITLRTSGRDGVDVGEGAGADAADEEAVLEVSDTGVGMDPATRARIFEPFFTTKERGKGTGLGLSMVYGFVRQSGGAIEVASEPGQGTTFTLAFPAVRAEVEAPREAPRPGAGVEVSDLHVLVVEDDPAVRRVIVRVLERAGANVLAKGTAEEALEALHEEARFDLVMTDLVLPGQSGRSLIETIRNRSPDTPVLLTSGYAGDSPGRPRDLPENIPFLEKPFTTEELVAEVRRVARRNRPD